jgi:hypothetical protein
MFLFFTFFEEIEKIFLPKNYKMIFVFEPRNQKERKQEGYLILFIPTNLLLSEQLKYKIISEVKLTIPDLQITLQTKDISILFSKGKPEIIKICFYLKNKEEKFKICNYLS